MSTDFENDRLITQYLLGNLPPAETERLDELSIADHNFAGCLQAVENDLVDACVRGELQGNVLQSFKSAYLSLSIRREKVQFARAFQAFAVPSQPIPKVQAAIRSAAPGGWRLRLFGRQWSLAAAFSPRGAVELATTYSFRIIRE